MRPNSVPDGHVLISLDTRSPVAAEQALILMHELLLELRSIEGIGPFAEIEIVSLSRGTIWAQVAIIVGTLVVGAGVIETAVQTIRTELQQKTGRLAVETAKTAGVALSVLATLSSWLELTRCPPARWHAEKQTLYRKAMGGPLREDFDGRN